MHEVDAKSAHTVLINQGHPHAEVTDSSLVLDVNDPWMSRVLAVA